jgi:membrane protein DedA with SNARE-associated domain
VAPSLAKATVTLERRGGPAIFAARWVGALRALVPLVAGAAGVPYRTVLAWDAPAALGWAAVAVSLGWFLGEHVATVVDRWGGYLSIAVVAVLAVYLLRRRAQTRDGSSTDL